MKKTNIALLLLTSTLASGTTLAQQAPACPQLPAGAHLHWNERIADGTAFCQALLEDGTEAFGLYISSERGFKPRSPNQLEQGSLNNQPLFWYRSEIAGDPGVDARETALELRKDVWVHVWMQTTSSEELDQRLLAVSQLRF